MPSADVYTSELVVSVAGTPLDAAASSLLVHGRVTDAASLPDSFDLEFADARGDLLQKAKIEIGTKVSVSVSENGPEPTTVLVEGEVTALEREDLGGSLITRVRGLDPSHRLFRGRRVRAFIDVKVSDVVQQVAGGAGLQALVSTTSGVHAKISQDNVTDWVFLKRLADRVGFTFFVERGRLHFEAPTSASEAPAGAVGARTDPVVIEHGLNTLYLRSTVTSSEQVPEVEVRGWDRKAKRAVVAKAPAKTRSAQLPVDPAKLAEVFDSPPFVLSVGDGDQPSQDALAKAMAERIAGGFAELEAVVLGSAKLRSGTAVSVRGFGSPFDGRYTVTETVHEFSADLGYTTKVHVTNASDRSLYGIAAGAAGGASGASSGASAGSAGFRYPGVLPAIVTKHGDSKGSVDARGMVAVKIPALSDDYESSWARLVQPGAAGKRGAVVVPEVGDEVLVAFEGGELDRPYVLGGLFNGSDQPLDPWDDTAKNGKVVRRTFTSRTGMVVEFLEDGSKEYVQISTNTRAQRVTLTQNGEKGIEIISEGPVKVVAKTDATVEASSGTIKLTGKTVDIEATTDLKLKGGTSAELGAAKVTVKADTAAELSGSTVAVKGQATAEISSSGATTVRGSLVKIN
ncbi:VgrG-related protein [Agromyces agglutinans]|uniref:VgrG-related protein n=1 Tax=Agromyces agglutinans TaxID=2662258 RepID=UPI001561E62C|nr:VgrG-related protein [Agromyces agglutinans]